MTEAPAQEPQPGGPPQFEESAVQVLASKVLLDWLRNRQQLLVPFTLDFAKLEKPRPELLIDGMVAAALAEGVDAKTATGRLEAALGVARASGPHREYARKALEQPRPLHEVLGEVGDVRAGAVLYAACVLAIDRRKPVNRHFLRYIAARLQLSEQLAKNVEQRFRSPL